MSGARLRNASAVLLAALGVLAACGGDAPAPAAPLPETEAACRETLALPIRPELDPADREHVAERIVDFVHR